MTKTTIVGAFSTFHVFRLLNLFRVSDFGFRIWRRHARGGTVRFNRFNSLGGGSCHAVSLFTLRWHVTCTLICKKSCMATKINMMKMLQQARGMAQITNRRPQNRPPGPLMLEMRFSGSRTAAARRKRIIRIRMQNPLDIPHPVKITHLGPNPPSAAATAPE
jgi:hypothetical protein